MAVMTSRPGRIKQIVDIDPPDSTLGGDRRSTPEFVEQRHHIWQLLQDEVAGSRQTVAAH
ncbi:hypothetical protein [Flexivirga oryzae]|uniref:ABC-type nitrate/sulfonate/bicarbonate transport system ATPase subunit n=1 Tax=Flexivirga oryzae TaxID=1794944 RepID=A0A839N6Z3_9MICO|nr:hypothetical protein [Flexivirga oryzae]MBB2890985.1 ABC-type nitrate/sulfonate/bicarbonate transport system ATPase subunit [Flexivirga oryzae]